MLMIRKICFWSAALAAFHPIKLYIDPLTIAGAVTGLGSLLGFFGGSSTNNKNLQIARETNQANKDIAAANNETSIRLMQYQNAWNREQWNIENEYNKPSNQVQRLLAAGINPAFSNQVGNGNSYVGLQSAPAPQLATPTMQAAVMQNPLANVASDFNQMASAWKAKADAAKAKNDIKRENRQTDQEIKESEARIEKINADADNVRKLTPVQWQEVKQRILNMRTEKLTKEQELRYQKVQYNIAKATEADLKKIPKVQLMKELETLRGIKNKNDFERVVQQLSLKHGLNPVASDGFHALMNSLYSKWLDSPKKSSPFSVWKDWNNAFNRTFGHLENGEWSEFFNSLWSDE